MKLETGNLKVGSGLLLAVVLGVGTAVAEDWPTLSGPHRNWTCNDKGLADSWPKDGPPVVWAVTNLGGGFGSPVVAGGKVFVIGRQLDMAVSVRKDKGLNTWPYNKCLPVPDVLTCLDRNTGKTLWTHEFNLLKNSAPTAWNTPTADGDFVYARGGDGEVRCVSVKDGKAAWVWPKTDPAWNRKLPGAYAIAASVLVCDDTVIFMGVDGKHTVTLVCLNKKTGAPVWEKETGKWSQTAANYPVIERDGEKLVLAGGQILKAKTGESVGKYHSEDSWTAVCDGMHYFGNKGKSTPEGTHFSDGKGEGHNFVVTITAEDIDSKAPDGAASKWEWSPSDTVADNTRYFNKAFGNPIVKDGHLFIFLGRKMEGQQLYCLDTETGKETWPKPELHKSGNQDFELGFTSLLYADGKLFFLHRWGTLVMLAADPKAYRVLGTAKVVVGTSSSLAISDGFAFVRDDLGVMKCLDLRVQK